MRILVVEDHLSLQQSIKDILEKDFKVDTADYGEDGLFMAEQSIYAAILLDAFC